MIGSFFVVKNEVNKISTSRTHEEYVELLKIRNPSIIPLKTYINSSTKILHKCLNCGNEWHVNPDQLLRGHKCPACVNGHRLTQKEFEDRVHCHGKLTVVGDYVNMRKKVKCKCSICNEVIEILAESAAIGKGHQKCSNRSTNNLLRKTTEQFINELNKVTSDIEILSEYKNAKEYIKCRCKTCEHIWNGTPTNLLRGVGCPQCCANKRKYTNDEFQKILEEEMPNVKILEEYKGQTVKIKAKCKVCGYIWNTAPVTLIQDHKGCYNCGKKRTGEKLKLTNNEFIEKLNSINPDILSLENYKDSKTKILVQCKKCEFQWYTKPNSLLNGHGCPYCNISKGETNISKYLDKNNITYEAQKTYDGLYGLQGGKLSYDFYLPEYNLLIEFQGKQHKQSIEYFGGEDRFKIQQEHDRRKREYSKLHKIKLIEIWYYDIGNVEEILNKELNKLNK